ncbi:NEDD8 ultimate buster 1 [Culicoides brevitarsis]|uniref:NEDD8 ultimate buster 1 n=1 Tax=Culicoides brevitarsis TaxID=469753 RepID=UPI00307BFF8E
MSHLIQDVLNQVRAQLNLEGVKLWDPPYYIDPEPIDDKLEELGRTYALVLNLPTEMCVAAVKELQSNALEKLAAKAKFNATGIASLKVRIPNQPGGTDLHTVEVSLEETGSALQEIIATKLNVTVDRVTLIFSGHVVDTAKTLSSQNVKNNQQLLALIRSADDSKDVYAVTAKIKSDAELLIQNSYSNDFLVMEDQQGNRIYLPDAENKALKLGLALHKKGRVYLNQENFNLALVLFLEADEQFRTVASSLLESVDNYALLNLDIVWCYLCLKSVTHLPDAERRLQLCEENFRRSYGTNFNRLVDLKGSDGNEKALVMRLHLLQAILMFHQNRRGEAQAMLRMAESELLQLKVDDAALQSLIEMGYGLSEARLGLRATGNNIADAINNITERREKKKEARKKARKNEELLGKEFRSGNVNPNSLKKLIEMNFDKDLSSMALEKADNDINEAINLLQNESEELRKQLGKRKKFHVEGNLLQNLVQMGFHTELAKMALQNSFNNLDSALDFLQSLRDDGKYEEVLSGLAGPSTSSQQPSIPLEELKEAKEFFDKKFAEKEAFERFSEGYNNDDDEHLDLPLTQEESLIQEYKAALNMN